VEFLAQSLREKLGSDHPDTLAAEEKLQVMQESVGEVGERDTESHSSRKIRRSATEGDDEGRTGKPSHGLTITNFDLLEAMRQPEDRSFLLYCERLIRDWWNTANPR